MKLYMIDGIAPFFAGYERDSINWSKIPFEHLETGGGKTPGEGFDFSKLDGICERFDRFARKASELGFNAITLDDLAHLSDYPGYPQALREKIQSYQQAYSRLFMIAQKHGLSVYLTTDVLYFHPSLSGVFNAGIPTLTDFLRRRCEIIFDLFPEVQGIIFRIGESDAKDVVSDFCSKLVIRTASDAKYLLKALLPAFELYQKQLVFRTWSVGTYAIGDLMWNRNTYSKVFDGIDSPQLIISMKYGESDFYRYLPLNKLVYRSKHKKIIELQARREYEGFGEYPSFIGWDYESYALQLKTAENIVGCSVWSQTGGWSGFRKLTFLENSSIWNEVNTYVSIKIFKDGWSTEKAIEQFYRENFDSGEWSLFLQLLRLSDEVVKELLYIKDFSGKKMFFRRVRIPPVLWVYWDQIIVNHIMRKLLRLYVFDAEHTVREGHLALEKIKTMQQLSDTIGIENSGLEFQYDTFEILCAAREYYLLPFSETLVERLEELKQVYERRYPERYQVMLDFKNISVSRKNVQRLLSILLRDKRGYRVFDRIFTIGVIKLLYFLSRPLNKRWIPNFAREKAMGIDAIFK